MRRKRAKSIVAACGCGAAAAGAPRCGPICQPRSSRRAMSLFKTVSFLTRHDSSRRLEGAEDRQDREALDDLPVGCLHAVAVDDDDVAGVDFRIGDFTATDADQIECRSLPLPADRPEDRD